MLANFFGKSGPIHFMMIASIFLLYFFAHYFINYQYLGLIDVGILVLLFLVVFFFYNFILFKNKLTLYNSYGFLLFIILFGVFSATNFDRNTVLFHGLLLIFLRRVYSLRSSKAHFKKLFDSGLLLGIFFFFEPFSVVFVVLIYTSNSLFQKTNWRTLLIPIAGFWAPTFCLYTYYFWQDSTQIFWNLFTWNLNFDFTAYAVESIKYPFYAIIILVVIAYFLKTPKVMRVRGNYRKYWVLLSVNFLVCLFFIAILNNKNGSELQYLFFPLSIIVANWLESFKYKVLKEVILLFILTSPILLLLV